MLLSSLLLLVVLCTISVLALPPPQTLKSLGSSFISALVNQWATILTERTQSVLELTYTPSGSGSGLAAIDTNPDVLVVGSDIPHAASSDLLHFPVALGGVVPLAHVPKSPLFSSLRALRLTPDVLAAVLQGDISDWTDPRITTLNAPLTRASATNASSTQPIPLVVVARGSSSGTTEVLSAYLSTAAAGTWTGGTASLVSSWSPCSTRVAGTADMRAAISSQAGTVGYVSSTETFGTSNDVLNVNLLVGGAIYAAPTPWSFSQALIGRMSSMPASDGDWSSVSIVGGHVVDGVGAASWPISTLSYAIARKDMRSAGDAGCAVKALLRWFATADAQYYAVRVSLVPLPKAMLDVNAAGVEKILVSNETLVDEYFNLISTVPIVKYV